jgi:hypothetical protein
MTTLSQFDRALVDIGIALANSAELPELLTIAGRRVEITDLVIDLERERAPCAPHLARLFALPAEADTTDLARAIRSYNAARRIS